MKQTETLESCSFCGKHKDAVVKLIVGENVAICNECVELCQTLLIDAPAVKPNGKISLDPRDILAHLNRYVIGQTQAKIVLSVAIANHYKRIQNPTNATEIEKVNILMLGPTGSGKTLLARSVARYLDVPFVIADATSLTEAGYVGDDVESMIARLLSAANGDVTACERGIVFLDEIDKIARKSESATVSRDVSGEGVQQALLKLVEGTRCRVPAPGSRKGSGSDMVDVDTTNILFIAGGAFVGLERITQNRVQGTAMGFAANIGAAASTEITVVPDDLVRYGMIPEFVGRFCTYVGLQDLTKPELIHILTGVQSNLVAQYQWLFEEDGIDLEFDTESLDLIAERTLQTRTGARGLHNELERVLLPHMFDLPRYNKQDIVKVMINKTQVNTPMTLLKQNQ